MGEQGEPIEKALRRFRKSTNMVGHLRIIRNRKQFESNHDKKIRKAKESAMRQARARRSARNSVLGMRVSTTTPKRSLGSHSLRFICSHPTHPWQTPCQLTPNKAFLGCVNFGTNVVKCCTYILNKIK